MVEAYKIKDFLEELKIFIRGQNGVYVDINEREFRYFLEQHNIKIGDDNERSPRDG